jgi:membrane protease YdiL (CAAX protease family)
MSGLDSFIYNLLIMAVIPAIGEELLFRGVIQQQLHFRLKNPHMAIWITAMLFSAIHMQFYGFIPRMLLGAFFGYLMVWTQSLWVPVLAHFLNNAGAVSMQYFLGAELTEEKIDTFGTVTDDWIYLVISGMALIFLLRFTYRIRVRN